MSHADESHLLNSWQLIDEVRVGESQDSRGFAEVLSLEGYWNFLIILPRICRAV